MTLHGQVRVRLLQGEEIALGPGKADLLDAIRHSGSISGAAKALGMSYRRAWLLVETMNHCFEPPLVSSAKGGKGGGGAEVTEEGLRLLAAFRRMQGEVEKVVNAHLPQFEQPASRPRRGGASRR
jgi:molybdate transport system regulatory protein